jgi:hypothetical protein
MSAPGEDLSTNLHWSRRKTVLGEHTRHPRTGVNPHEHQVIALRLPDAGIAHAQFHTGNDRQ